MDAVDRDDMMDFQEFLYKQGLSARTVKHKTVIEPIMASIKRLTITLPADMAGLVKDAVKDGDYASSSEVIREALRDWKLKCELRLHQLAELKVSQSVLKKTFEP